MIGTLNPRPVMDIQKDDTEYVVPDILIVRQNGQWEVTLNDGGWENIDTMITISA